MNMIDIHTHILPSVDDGAPNLETSLSLIEASVHIGVTDLFLTPHYMRKRGYLSSAMNNQEVFVQLVKTVEEKAWPITLHLGTEIYYTIDTIQDLRNKIVLPLGKSKLVLLEFSTEEDHEDLGEAIHNILALGYIPVIAHMERYPYASENDWGIIKKMGALIQVNAASLLGNPNRSFAKKCIKMIKKGHVDFIASDIHQFRSNHMKDAYVLVNKKFGPAMADRLFNNKTPLAT
jgi:protein-tyrosine phosphatase